mmetsp:Transcript_26189/g.80894  ORF Transcript_26189/g.80894 Transcript_26189/m.80894 type:complete len:227 (-) Transcript_26189:849-1529(-)
MSRNGRSCVGRGPASSCPARKRARATSAPGMWCSDMKKLRTGARTVAVPTSGCGDASKSALRPLRAAAARDAWAMRRRASRRVRVTASSTTTGSSALGTWCPEASHTPTASYHSIGMSVPSSGCACSDGVGLSSGSTRSDGRQLRVTTSAWPSSLRTASHTWRSSARLPMRPPCVRVSSPASWRARRGPRPATNWRVCSGPCVDSAALTSTPDADTHRDISHSIQR